MTGVRPTPTVPRWIIWLLLLAWFGLLIVWARHAKPASVEIAVLSRHDGAKLFALFGELALSALSDLVRCVPMGFLAALALPSWEGWLQRTLRSGLPAVAISFFLAAVVKCFQAESVLGTPGMLELLLPWTGCLIGAWAGMSFTRGRTARLLFVPKLALVVTLLTAAFAVVLYRTVDSSPLLLQTPVVTSAEKRRLYDLFAGKNPLKIEEGTTVELSLSAQDINLLLAWGFSAQGTARSALVDLEGNGAQLQASMPILGHSRYLNVTAQGSFSVDAGRLALQADRLRIGHVAIPTLLLKILSPRISRLVSDDSRVKPMLQLLQGVDLKPGVVTLRYGHGVLPKGFVAGLFHDLAAEQPDISGIKAQILNLLDSAHKMTGNAEARFGNTVQTAFLYAREHSSSAQAVKENRDAVLALGIALGHPRVETLIGSFLDEATRNAVRSAFARTTLRKREDWPKHFFVSAALTVIAAGNVSNATGLFKEEKDAAGGSGFSFGDLLADRSGTTFAEVATRNETTAHALQERLAQGFNVDDYFPDAQGLPEDLQDAEFRARYGGVGGEGYRRLTAEIERRISTCAAYRDVR